VRGATPPHTTPGPVTARTHTHGRRTEHAGTRSGQAPRTTTSHGQRREERPVPRARGGLTPPRESASEGGAKPNPASRLAYTRRMQRMVWHTPHAPHALTAPSIIQPVHTPTSHCRARYTTSRPRSLAKRIVSTPPRHIGLASNFLLTVSSLTWQQPLHVFVSMIKRRIPASVKVSWMAWL